MMKKWTVLAGIFSVGLVMSHGVLLAQSKTAAKATTTAEKTTTNATSDKNAVLLRPAIELNSIEPIKKTESSGDEIYVGITEFNSNGKNSYYSIPQSPVYWPSQALHQINNFQLWQGKLPVNGATEVIVALIEQDTPPWDLDDLIGTIKIKMMNDGGKMHYEWFQEGKSLGKDKPQVTVKLTGSGGTYQAKLSLVMRDNTKAERNPDPTLDKK